MKFEYVYIKTQQFSAHFRDHLEVLLNQLLENLFYSQCILIKSEIGIENDGIQHTTLPTIQSAWHNLCVYIVISHMSPDKLTTT